MVKAGFIGEGDCEKILLSSPEFRNFLAGFEIEPVNEVINAGGRNKLFHAAKDFSRIQPRVDSWLNILQDKGAEKIFILVDIDEFPCITEFKPNIYRRTNDVVIVAKKALEAWYLSDIDTLRKYLQANVPFVTEPEAIMDPFQHLNELSIQFRGRGITDKKILTRQMIKLGFSLPRAADHPHCSSARYFLQKLNDLNASASKN